MNRMIVLKLIQFNILAGFSLLRPAVEFEKLQRIWGHASQDGDSRVVGHDTGLRFPKLWPQSHSAINQTLRHCENEM